MKKIKRIKKRPVDFTLLITTILLVIIGIIMVYSVSWPEAQAYGDSSFYLRRHLFFGVSGFFIMVFVMNINYRTYYKLAPSIYFIGFILVILLLFTPLGVSNKGAIRWLKLGPFTFMPGDYIKIASIIYFAKFLSDEGSKNIGSLKGSMRGLARVALSVGLIIVQQDLGTSITLLGTLGLMLIIGGLKPLIIYLGLGSGILIIYKVFNMALNDPRYADNFRAQRIISFIDPFKYSSTIGFQAVNSLYALGSGGLLGLGLGKSKQKFFYLPEPYTDFIFAVIGEEIGFIGGVIIIILYMIIIYRGSEIALQARDSFGFFLGIGITILIALQTIIHIAVVTSSMPITGITLPLISYGGTSLWIYMASIGILLNISKYR